MTDRDLDYPFPYLVDEPEDGSIDTYGWLPADVASTPDVAVAKFTAAYVDVCGYAPWEEDALVLVAVGKVSLRAIYETWDEYADVVSEKLYGREAVRAAENVSQPEDLRWDSCEPDDDGAAEWWKLEVRSAAP